MNGAAIAFTPNHWQGRAHASAGTVPASGCLLSIYASARLDEIDVSLLRDGIHCGFRVSAADARALAAELLTAAAAVDAAQVGGKGA